MKNDLSQAEAFQNDPMRAIEQSFSVQENSQQENASDSIVPKLSNIMSSISSFAEQHPIVNLLASAAIAGGFGKASGLSGRNLVRHIGNQLATNAPEALRQEAIGAMQSQLFNPQTYAELNGALGGEGSNIGGQMLRNKMMAIYSRLPNEAVKAKFRKYMEEKGITL